VLTLLARGVRLNPGQERFRALRGVRWSALLGGQGAGKTFAGARKLIDLLGANPGVDALVVAPFWGTIYHTVLREFLAAVPPPLLCGHMKRERRILLAGDRSVWYGSADTPATLDGVTVGAVWLDEARYCEPDAWRVIDGRLRDARATRLEGIVTSTPGGSWLQAEFGGERPDRAAVHVSTRENVRNVGAGYLDSLLGSLSARAAKVFVEGQFGLLEGAVYDSFARSTHLVDWRYDRELPCVVGVDFGYRKSAVLFAQPVPYGARLGDGRVCHLQDSWVVFDELMPENMPTAALVDVIKSRGYKVDWCAVDPAGDARDTATGIPDVELMEDAGLRCRWETSPILRHIPNSVRMVDAMLLNARGETRLFFARPLGAPSASPRGVVRALENYSYPEPRPDKALTDMPVKDGTYDHAMDALRYLVLNVRPRGPGAGVVTQIIR
jgi:hypothetical protein